jgi:hypothetical protein
MLLTIVKQFCVHRQWGSYPQTFARSVVDLVGYGIKLRLTVNR